MRILYIGRKDPRWDVLAAEGRPLLTLYCDRRLRILGATAGDVWGLVTDDERKPRLIHYEIEPRP